MTQAVLIMAAVAVAASSRLKSGGTLAVCAMVFVMGLTSEYFLDVTRNYAYTSSWVLWDGGGFLGDRVTVVDALYNIYYGLVPNFQHFWMSDALTREQDIPMVYVWTATKYAVSYGTAVLLLACFLFEKREVD